MRSKYTALPSQTRLVLGLGVMGYATFALFVSDSVEEPLGLKATEADRKELKELVPKIRTVERDSVYTSGGDSGRSGN